MSSPTNSSSAPKKGLGPILLFILVVVAGFIIYQMLIDPGAPKQTIGTEEKPIIVGGKNFLESSVLLEIITMELEALGAAVKKKHNEGQTGHLYPALVNGNIHIYPDYSGTFLDYIFDKNPTKKSEYPGNEKQNNTYDRLNYIVENELEPPHRYKILHPFLGVNNTYVMVMEESKAKQVLGGDHSLTKLGSVELEEDFRGGFSYDFTFRPDGYKGLKQTYGLNIPVIDGVKHGAIKYQRLLNGEFDIVDGYASDPQLYFADKNLVVLKDGKSFFPYYYPIPIVRKEVLSAYPKLEGRLKKIADRLTIRDVAMMVREAENAGITPASLEDSAEHQAKVREIIKSQLK